MAQISNILLTVDGSQQSIDAFKKGINLAQKLGATVYLVRVIDNVKDEISETERNSLLRALEEYASNHGIRVHRELVYGEPRIQIAEVLVDKWDIDLIVMGATGKGVVRKMMVGSITDYVLRNAKCNVLICR